MKRLITFALALSIAACGNPGGISDSEYAKYKELGAPKILYSCNKGETLGFDINAVQKCLKLNDPAKELACVNNAEREKKPIIDIGYAAGIGVAVTYNKLLGDAKDACSGEFKILESTS